MVLLWVLNGLVWGTNWLTYRSDMKKRLQKGPFYESSLFDADLNELWKAGSVKIKPNLTDKDEDLLIKKDFERWLELEANKDKDLEEYLWEDGILNPQEVVWAEGIPLMPGNPDDLETFEKIKDKALLEGIYNSVPLEDGGRDNLYITWFMLKGTSDYGARKLLEQGVKPWEFDFDI